jgi:lipopolysaccharide/colanic/teichoic acid biosynthesis glycosyltransferase
MITDAIWKGVPLKDDPGLRPPSLRPEQSTERSDDCSDAERLSAWVRSPAKRAFDLVLVLVMLPVLLPLLLIVACVVRLTSRGPALFLQKRVGRNGTLFTIYKFRTMQLSDARRGAITTIDDPAITKVGRFLRWWKLDELPQFLNVVRGEMSLVGPRPKVPEQQTALLRCRPGITGEATIAFAQEEVFLAGIPEGQLQEYFRNVLLPLKESLDSSYMAKATPFSDLRLLLCTAVRRWNHTEISDLLARVHGNSRHGVRTFEPRLGLGD